MLLVAIPVLLAIVVIALAPYFWQQEETANAAQDRLYARSGRYFSEDDAALLMAAEKRDAFQFSGEELRALADLRAHTPYAPLPLEVHEDTKRG